jgi:hypothetical protein
VGLDSHDFLFRFCVVRRIGVHLFRFRVFRGVVRREASPPFRTTRRGIPPVCLLWPPLSGI